MTKLFANKKLLILSVTLMITILIACGTTSAILLKNYYKELRIAKENERFKKQVEEKKQEADMLSEQLNDYIVKNEGIPEDLADLEMDVSKFIYKKTGKYTYELTTTLPDGQQYTINGKAPSPIEDLDENGVPRGWKLFSNSSCAFDFMLPLNAVQVESLNVQQADVWNIIPTLPAGSPKNQSYGVGLYLPKTDGFAASYISILVSCLTDLSGKNLNSIQPQEYLDSYVTTRLTAKSIETVEMWGQNAYKYIVDISEHVEPQEYYIFGRNGDAYILQYEVRDDATSEQIADSDFIFENLRFK